MLMGWGQCSKDTPSWQSCTYRLEGLQGQGGHLGLWEPGPSARLSCSVGFADDDMGKP